MKSFARFLTLLALTLSAPAFAAPTPSFTDSGTSSLTILPAVEGRGETYIKTETRYLEMEYPTENFLKAVITTTRYSGAEGGEGKVALTMLANDKGRLDKVLWTAQLEGQEVKVFNDELIAVTTYGCCGSSDTTRLLNVATGKRVEAAYDSVYQFNVPNAQLPQRYLSLAVDSKAPPQAQGKTYIGTFSYYTANKIIARMRVYADLPSGWGTQIYPKQVSGLISGSRLEVQRDTRVTLWDSDGQKDPVKAYSGFVLESSLSYDKQDETVRIVINQDTIDAVASSGTKGLYLELVK